MKNVFKSTLTISLLGTLFIASSAIALTFQGYGGWRTTSGHGNYKTYAKTWKQCHDMCVSNSQCTGVEFSMRSNGKTSCEIHKGKFHEVASGTGHATVWTK